MNDGMANKGRRSEKAKLSLIFGCLSWLTPLFIGNILAVVFGYQALKELRINPQLEGREMAQWGIAIGLISIPLEFAAIFLFFRLLYPNGGH
jgi:Domain of unknown function (DUF4190)